VRARGLGFALAAAAILTTATVTRAARLPDWAEPIALDAPEVGSGESERDWRVLLDDTEVVVRPDGRLTVRHRLAVQALREHPSSIAVGAFAIDAATEIRRAKAWHSSPAGAARKSRVPAIEVGIDPGVLTDVRARLVSVPGLELGSVAFVEFEAVESPETLTYTHSFREQGPMGLARLAVEMPQGWELRWDWPDAPGPGPTREGTTAVWELRDAEAVSEDDAPLGAPADSDVPLLVLAFVPPAGAEPDGVAVVPNWPALAAWYEELNGDRHAATPEVAAAAARLAPGDTAFADRVGAAGRYVRDRIRYVAREIGIGAIQPRPAPQVLEEKLGDCKDKATLLRALLAALDVESYPILIHATREHTVSPEVPAPGAFNHMVVGIPVPPDAEPGPAFAPATVALEDGGHLLVVDPTDEWASVGSLPAYLAGKRGLLVAGERSGIVTLPDGDPRAHRIERARTTRAGADGTLVLELRTMRFGEPAETARQAWRRSAAARRQEVETALVRGWPGAVLLRHDVEEEAPGGEFVEMVAWSASRSLQGTVALFPDLLDDVPRVRLDGRELPVVHPWAWSLSTEHRVEGVDRSVALPSPVETEGEGWRVATRYEREGAVVVARCEVELSRRRFDPAEFDELRGFWTTVRRAVSGSVAVD
jgi:hypothetical protein